MTETPHELGEVRASTLSVSERDVDLDVTLCVVVAVVRVSRRRRLGGASVAEEQLGDLPQVVRILASIAVQAPLY